ncbi:MAG: hypothetical protein WC783_03415 [Candidatus Paceibacterota bacterium]|jgi:hypothetical protein
MKNYHPECPVKGKCIMSTSIADQLTFGLTREFDENGFPDKPCPFIDCPDRVALVNEVNEARKKYE